MPTKTPLYIVEMAEIALQTGGPMLLTEIQEWIKQNLDVRVVRRSLSSIMFRHKDKFQRDEQLRWSLIYPEVK